MLKDSRWVLWLILGFALLLRVGMALAVDRHVHAQGRLFLIEGDAEGYWELAHRIITGDDYCIHQPPRYVHRMPGFPLLLSACLLVLGDSVFRASLVLAGIGTVCVGLTWLLAKRTVGKSTAVAAAVLTAISPLQAGNSVLILSETWFAFWLLLCLLALQKIPGRWIDVVNESRQSGWWAFGCGILTGIGVLVRPGWLLWTGLSGLLVLYFGEGSCGRRIGRAVLIGVGCLAVLTPWAWRNHQVTGHWVFTSLWSGPSLYDGLHEQATGASDMRFFDDEKVPLRMSEYEVNEHYKQRAIEFVRTHPGRSVELAVYKAGRYLSPVPNAPGFTSGGIFACCLAYYVCLGSLGCVGAWSLRKKKAVLLLLAGPFLQFLLVHMVFVGSVRYRLPVEFPLSIIAAAGLNEIWNRIRSRTVTAEHS